MVIDVLAAIVISFGVYLGYQRGLIKTVFDTLSLIIGIVAALKLSPIVIDILQKLLQINPAITFILGIAVTFIGVMYLIRYVGKKFEDLLEAVNLNFINKLAGGTLQGFFFATILAFGIGLVDKVSLLNQQTKDQSFSYPHLVKVPAISQGLITAMKPIFTGFWNKTLETIESVKSKNDTSN
jgi:membrane protein required for colicin V production